MLEVAQPELKTALDVARSTFAQRSVNGVRYGTCGETRLSPSELEQIVRAVPDAIATALRGKTYYFVPLTVPDTGEVEDSSRTRGPFDPGKTMVALDSTTEMEDRAICHRNLTVDGDECTFISTRLMQDRFALAFEFYINVGHQFVDAVGVPESFANLAWSQVESGVRGETSQDAWELRAQAIGQQNRQIAQDTPPSRTRRNRMAPSGPKPMTQHVLVADEKARGEYFEAAFADAIAMYVLSLTVDFDYTELREREYPLLAAAALAERLRHVAQLFPPNAGNEFAIHYRRKNG